MARDRFADTDRGGGPDGHQPLCHSRASEPSAYAIPRVRTGRRKPAGSQAASLDLYSRAQIAAVFDGVAGAQNGQERLKSVVPRAYLKRVGPADTGANEAIER